MKHRWDREYDPDAVRYCSIAAAILGAGAMSAGAGIWGANTAAGAQTAATDKAINQTNLARVGNLQALAPYLTTGAEAIPNLMDWINPSGGAKGNNPLSALIKLTTPGASMTDTLKQTPGYQFAEERGLKSVDNALAARGLGGSPGAVSKGAADFTTGLASNTWQSVVNALQNLFQSGTGALQSAVGTGANAAGNFAGGNIATNNTISGLLTGQGNAQAGAAMATGNAIGNLGGSISTAALIQKLLGGGGAVSGSGATSGGGLYGNPEVAGNPWSAGGVGDANYWG